MLHQTPQRIPEWHDVDERTFREDVVTQYRPAVLRGLVSSFDAEFQRRMLQNVILAGGGSQLRGLDRLIEEDLQQYGGGKVIKVHEPDYAGANGALKLAADMPEEYWKAVN